MTTQDSFAVVTRLSYEPRLKNKVMRLMYISMPVYKRQEGLIHIAMHHDLKEPKAMTYFVWESEKHYLKSMNSDELAPITDQWNEMIQSGQATFEMNAYFVIDSYLKHSEAIF